jgi:hypothetical protein
MDATSGIRSNLVSSELAAMWIAPTFFASAIAFWDQTPVFR